MLNARPARGLTFSHLLGSVLDEARHCLGPQASAHAALGTRGRALLAGTFGSAATGLWQNQIPPHMEPETHVPPARHLLLSQTRSSTQEVAYVAPEADRLLRHPAIPLGDRAHSERLPGWCPLPAAPKN